MCVCVFRYGILGWGVREEGRRCKRDGIRREGKGRGREFGF